MHITPSRRVGLARPEDNYVREYPFSLLWCEFDCGENYKPADWALRHLCAHDTLSCFTVSLFLTTLAVDSSVDLVLGENMLQRVLACGRRCRDLVWRRQSQCWAVTSFL